LIDDRYVLYICTLHRALTTDGRYSWFRDEEMAKRWNDIKDGKGPPGEKAVPPEGYYFRTFPTFEAPPGKCDWLNRTVVIGTGARSLDGNLIQYYKVL
jgi:hypothetical protein